MNMTREEALAKLIDVIDPIDEITEDTSVADCEDIDSLALFSIFVFLKTIGKQQSLAQLSKCEKVSDFIDIIVG
jgi:acyl carrier protein